MAGYTVSCTPRPLIRNASRAYSGQTRWRPRIYPRSSTYFERSPFTMGKLWCMPTTKLLLRSCSKTSEENTGILANDLTVTWFLWVVPLFQVLVWLSLLILKLPAIYQQSKSGHASSSLWSPSWVWIVKYDIFLLFFSVLYLWRSVKDQLLFRSAWWRVCSLHWKTRSLLFWGNTKKSH